MAVDNGGLLPLDAPLPQPRRYTLLDAATLVTDDSRWLGGARVWGYPPGPAFTFDPCGTGTYRAKESGGDIPQPGVGAFTVYQPGICTAVAVGPTADRYKARLRSAFEAIEATAVERFFATGDGHVLLGPYLTDGNLDILGGGAVDPVEGLRLLENNIGERGNGMIHVTPGGATYLTENGLIAPEASGGVRQMRTVGNGTLVAVGAGYIGAYPDDQPGTPAAGREWIYASGFVQYRRGEVEVMPESYADAIERQQNEVVFLAERNYLLTWVGRQDSNDASNIQAGVLIDRLS